MSNFLLIIGIFSKNSRAFATVKFKISLIFFVLNKISKVCGLYLCPSHLSHFTYTSDKKCISTFITPSPSQDSHLPPLTLKLNLPVLYPLDLASGVCENKSLI